MYRGFGYAVAVDGTGSVLLTGFASGPIDFGGGPLRSDSASIFAAKYTGGGQHLWSKRFRSGGGQGNGICADGQGNVLVTGAFTNLGDFGGGEFATAGGASSDVFLAKFKP